MTGVTRTRDRRMPQAGHWVRERPRGVRAAVTSALVATTLAIPQGAWAEEPLDLPGELTDLVGVVDDPAAIESRQDAWFERTGLQLFVVVVDDVDDMAASEWLDETAELSGLGEQDVAVVVGEDGSAAIRALEGAGLPSEEVAAVESRTRATAGVDGAAAAAEVAVTSLTELTPRDADAQVRRVVAWGFGLLVALLVVTGSVLWLRRWRGSSRRQAEAEARAEELSTALGGDVVALDHDLEEAQLAVDLAAAQLDRAQTASVRGDVAASRQDALEVARRRADLSIGPTDDLTWRRPVPEVVAELEALRTRAAEARARLAEAMAELRRLTALP